ncbi:hypothetical protein L873DRAFT_1714177, partial [Choiromyces venosus 120613-1]
YSGYKKAHKLQFQGWATLHSLIQHLARPYAGRMSDWGIWCKSKIQEEINKCARGIEGKQLFVFGDGTYGLQSGVIGAY